MRGIGFSLLMMVGGLLLFSSCVLVGPLQFNASDQPQILEWAQNFDGNPTVRFEPRGLVGAGERLFLFGSFTTPAVAVRSFVLMSENGGKSWREVAHPVEGSEVISLRFPDPVWGFALVGRVTEGPGALHVQRTADGGLTWEKMAWIPKDNYSGWPVAFDFVDKEKGRLVLQYMDDNPEDLRPVLTTKDGGRTWQTFFNQGVNNGEDLGIRNDFSLKFKDLNLALMETDTNWILSAKGAREPVFVFPRDVALDQVIAVEPDDCG